MSFVATILGLGNKVLLPEYGQKKVPDLEQLAPHTLLKLILFMLQKMGN
jgi:hypothetical protein